MCFNEQLAILVASEDIFAMIAPVHHVINRPLVLDSEFTSHGEAWQERPKTNTVNTKNRPLYGLTDSAVAQNDYGSAAHLSL